MDRTVYSLEPRSVGGEVTTSVSYSVFGEPNQETARVAGTSLLDVHYTRDELGRITRKSETVQGAATVFDYGYDLAGRLVEVRENGIVSASYQYDANSNRVAGYSKRGGISAAYDEQDRLTDYNGISYTYTYTYTGNGELLTKNEAGAITQYGYDVLGNLRKVTLADGTIIDYVIDGRNRRIGKKVNGALVQGFLYQDQLNPVAEFDGAGNLKATYIYGSKPNVPVNADLEDIDILACSVRAFGFAALTARVVYRLRFEFDPVFSFRQR